MATAASPAPLKGGSHFLWIPVSPQAGDWGSVSGVVWGQGGSCSREWLESSNTHF